MAENSKYNKEFTARDIERYYSGKMSTLEMHELEKAAMEDPFLADALEGYSYTNTPVEDSKYLQTQLQSKIGGSKIIPLKSFSTNRFLRIAALFILLAGCGWAVYQFGFNTRNNDIASVKKPAIKAPVPSIATDTNNIATDTNNKEADLQEATAKQNATANAPTNTQTKTIKTDNTGTVSASTQNRHTAKLNNTRNAKKQQQNEEAIQAEISSAEKAQTETASASLKKDTNADIQGYGVPRGTDTPQTISPGKDNVIVLQRSKSAPIPEVVLSNTKRDSTYRKPHISFEEAEPANGTAYYDDYVANNLQIPAEELQKNSSGEVKLSFDVNDAGQAVNIKVEKSLCAECDKEAIRVLQQGPKWLKKKKDKKGKLSIRF
jgi:hypothetical protein